MRVALSRAGMRRRNDPPSSGDATGSAPRRRAASAREDRSSAGTRAPASCWRAPRSRSTGSGGGASAGRRSASRSFSSLRAKGRAERREASRARAVRRAAARRDRRHAPAAHEHDLAAKQRRGEQLEHILHAASSSGTTITDEVRLDRHPATGGISLGCAQPSRNEAEILECLGQEGPDRTASDRKCGRAARHAGGRKPTRRSVSVSRSRPCRPAAQRQMFSNLCGDASGREEADVQSIHPIHSYSQRMTSATLQTRIKCMTITSKS